MAQQKTISSRKAADPDDAKLAAAGFDAHVPAAEAIAKLAEIRPNVGDIAYARALGTIADPAAAAILAEFEVSASGALRREVRRSLFKLRQRGIEPLAPTAFDRTAARRACRRRRPYNGIVLAYRRRRRAHHLDH